MNTTADSLARSLAENEPSAGHWETVDVSALSRTGLIDALTGVEKVLAHIQALQIRILAALSGNGGVEPVDCTEEEISAATRWSPTSTRNRLHQAEMLAGQFPETLELMRAGTVSWPQANALIEITAGLEPEQARRAGPGARQDAAAVRGRDA